MPSFANWCAMWSLRALSGRLGQPQYDIGLAWYFSPFKAS
jgi:hypothetical protein